MSATYLRQATQADLTKISSYYRCKGIPKGTED